MSSDPSPVDPANQPSAPQDAGQGTPPSNIPRGPIRVGSLRRPPANPFAQQEQGRQEQGRRPPNKPRQENRPRPQTAEAKSTESTSPDTKPAEKKPAEQPRLPTAQEQERAEDEAAAAMERQPKASQAPKGPVPVPNRRAPMPADLQAEIDAALEGVSLNEVVNKQVATGERLENESRHRGQVVDLHGDNVFFSLGGKDQGVASLRSFKTPPQIGEVIDVVVSGFNSEDSLYELVVPGGTIVAGDWGDIVEGSIVDATVTGANTGGLECSVKNLRGFIPASQTGLYRVENLGDFIGQKLVCVVTEANQGRGNLVLSRRAVLEREKEESKKQTMAELQPGQVRDGIVRKVMDFGAFVDIGGVDGLIHVSQMSWDRVAHPSEVVAEGQKVRVRIEKIDEKTGKIGLSLKNPEEDPWTGIEYKFPVGSTIRGKVTRIAQFGAFVRIAPGVEGLIHVSELAHNRVYKVENVVKEGEEVEAKILSIDPEAQRIGLSLKATISKPVKEGDAAKAAAEEVEEPLRPLAVPKRGGPLKGGTGKPSGGDQFGLKW